MRFLLVALFLLVVRAPAAADRKFEYLVELGNGVSIPLGGDNYTNLVDPSYKASLRFAFDVPIIAGLLLGPAVQLDAIPVNSDDGTFDAAGLDARFGRVRFLLGGDVRYRVIPRLDLWLRVLVGVDHVGGSVQVKLFNGSSDYSSTTFGLEASIGATFQVWRMIVVGLGFGFPIAVNHQLTGPGLFGTNSPAFNAGDLDITALVGARF